MIVIDISEEEVLKHPDVVKAIETETAKINASSDPISQQMYMDALRNGIDLAEETRREKSPEGPRYVIMCRYNYYYHEFNA